MYKIIKTNILCFVSKLNKSKKTHKVATKNNLFSYETYLQDCTLKLLPLTTKLYIYKKKIK